MCDEASEARLTCNGQSGKALLAGQSTKMSY